MVKEGITFSLDEEIYVSVQLSLNLLDYELVLL